MARSRRSANSTAPQNESSAPAPESASVPAASSLDDFDAEASLLALQKHVAAASALPTANGTEPQPVATVAGVATSSPAVVSQGQLYAAAAAAATQVLPQQNNAGLLDPESEIHPDLRSAQVPLQPQPPPPQQQQQQQQQQPQQQQQQQQQPIQPAYPLPVQTSIMSSVGGPPIAQPTAVASAIPQHVAPMTEGAPGESPVTDGRKGPRRELSQSKRAAQNRAAQRAFRQRKEGYIKKLEQQVQTYAEMENQFKLIQSENYNLREYVIHLQSKLLDVKVDLPQPPANLNLSTLPSSVTNSVPGAVGGTDLGSAASAAASLLANAAAAAAANQNAVQPQSAAPTAQIASVSTSTTAPTPAQTSPSAVVLNNSNPLARVAQAVAQLGAANSASAATTTATPSADIKQELDQKQSVDEPMPNADDIDTQLQASAAESLTTPAVASM